MAREPSRVAVPFPEREAPRATDAMHGRARLGAPRLVLAPTILTLERGRCAAMSGVQPGPLPEREAERGSLDSDCPKPPKLSTSHARP
jgi:hypothetical protein